MFSLEKGRPKNSLRYLILKSPSGPSVSSDAEDDKIFNCLLSGVRPRREINNLIKYEISVPEVPRFR